MRASKRHSLQLIGCIATAVIASGCAMHRPNPEAVRMATMEKQLSKNEETIADLSHRLSVLQFMVDNHERMLRTKGDTQTPPPAPRPSETAAITTGLAIVDETQPPTPAGTPQAPALAKDPNQIYDDAFTAMRAKEFDRAGGMFRHLAENHPSHALADNALYWLGECHYARREYQAAIAAFSDVQSRYPHGGKVPDALLKTGFAQLSMGDTSKARQTLKKVIADYPFTDAAAKAEARLKTLF